jgi:hypothetical protein
VGPGPRGAPERSDASVAREFRLRGTGNRDPSGRCSGHEALFESSSAVQTPGTRMTTPGASLLTRLTCNDGWLVPLAGLEPATCCLGDVSAQTLCSNAKLLVTSDRRAKVIVSSDLREVSRYPARTPSAAIGHVHCTVEYGPSGPLTAWPAVIRGRGSAYGGPCAGHGIPSPVERPFPLICLLWPRGSGAAAPQGALRAMDASANRVFC